MALNSKALSPARSDAARAFLRAALERRAMTESAYAKAIGFSQSQLNDFLNGRTSGGLALLERIADFESASIDEIVARVSPKRAELALTTPAEHAAAAARLVGFSELAIAAGLADARASDDAWSILGLIERAHRAAQRTTSIQPFGPPETDKPPQGHTANNARLLAAKKKRGER